MSSPDPTRGAGPSTLVGLQHALMERLADVVAPFWQFPTKSGEKRAPAIVDGWLAPKSTSLGEDFPFVAVRPRSGRDSEAGPNQDATAIVELILGVYSDDDDGWHDLLLLIEAIRQDLAAAPVIAGAFAHVGPLLWEIADEQPRPQWLASVTTTYRIPRARRVEARDPTED